MRSIHLGARPWIVGHRGALPGLENTIPSFELAVREGANAVECDVQSTRDGALVLFHDETLVRFAPEDGRVLSGLELEELRTVALAPGSDRRASAIPTLAELFAALPESFPVNVEVKAYADWSDRLLEALLAALYGRANVFVSSFDRRLLGHLRREAPELPLATLADRLDADLVELSDELGAWAIHLAEAPPAARTARLRQSVLVYTVNDPAEARRLLRCGVAGLFTDRPGLLRAALADGTPVVGKLPPTVV